MIKIIRNLVDGFINEHRAQQARENAGFELYADVNRTLGGLRSKLVVRQEFERCFYVAQAGAGMPFIEGEFRKQSFEFARKFNDVVKAGQLDVVSLPYSRLSETTRGNLAGAFVRADDAEAREVRICDLRALCSIWMMTNDVSVVCEQSARRDEGAFVAAAMASVRKLSPYDHLVR